MLNIAIIEDDGSFSAQLGGFLERYGTKKGLRFHVERFSNAVLFLEGGCSGYDLVFLDINMPYLNGMDAAGHLRQQDAYVTIVFITSLAQYALDGYSVGAADFILKPLSYDEFFLKFTRILRHLKPRPEASIAVQTQGCLTRVNLSEVRYIESQKHNAVYHLGHESVSRRASLSAIERELGRDFARCNNCYIVNLNYIQSIKGHSVFVDGTELSISQPRRRAFVQRYEEFMGGAR